MCMVKYDDYIWHCKGEYPIDLAPENGATHIGIYFTWCLDNNLLSSKIWEDHQKELEDIKKRKLTGSQFLLFHYRGILTSDLLNELGNAFTMQYYEEDGEFSTSIANYFSDYSQSYHLGADQDLYYVLDTWENYFLIEDVLDHRFKQYQVLCH